MMNLLLLVIVSLDFFLCSDALEYFISPDPVTNETCNNSGSAALRPCYSLQQLSIGNGLLFNKGTITLLLLSGTHILPENHTLMLSNIRKVEIFPWNQQQEELIECRSQTNIVFQNIQELNIFSVNLTSCTILLESTIQVVIFKCVFAKSKENYAITISNPYGTIRDPYGTKINISIHNSIFCLNYGAITRRRDNIDNIILFINNTMFLSNRRTGYGGILNLKYVDLKVQESLFVNNTASCGAMCIADSSVHIISTSFLNNYATGPGGAISLITHRDYRNFTINIDDCLFKIILLGGMVVQFTQISG